MGRYDKEKGRWVSFNEDVEEAAEMGRKMVELGGVHNSDVAAEQADWDADEGGEIVHFVDAPEDGDDHDW